MVKRERGQGVGPTSVYHHADPVGRSPGNKSLNDGLDRLEPVDSALRAFVILRQHAGRKVNRQHDVVPFLANLFFFLQLLRPGQRQHQRHKSQDG